MADERFKMPNIDERVHAVGVAHLRKINSGWLAKLGDQAYIIQGPDDSNLAVLVSYEMFLELQRGLKP